MQYFNPNALHDSRSTINSCKCQFIRLISLKIHVFEAADAKSKAESERCAVTIDGNEIEMHVGESESYLILHPRSCASSFNNWDEICFRKWSNRL